MPMPQSVVCLERAIDAFTDLGRLSLAAKHHKDIAEMLESEGKSEKAMFHYEQVTGRCLGPPSRAVLKQTSPLVRTLVAAPHVLARPSPHKTRSLRCVSWCNLPYVMVLCDWFDC